MGFIGVGLYLIYTLFVIHPNSYFSLLPFCVLRTFWTRKRAGGSLGVSHPAVEERMEDASRDAGEEHSPLAGQEKAFASGWKGPPRFLLPEASLVLGSDGASLGCWSRRLEKAAKEEVFWGKSGMEDIKWWMPQSSTGSGRIDW